MRKTHFRELIVRPVGPPKAGLPRTAMSLRLCASVAYGAKVTTTGPWSLEPISRCTTADAALSASACEART